MVLNILIVLIGPSRIYHREHGVKRRSRIRMVEAARPYAARLAYYREVM